MPHWIIAPLVVLCVLNIVADVGIIRSYDHGWYIVFKTFAALLWVGSIAALVSAW